MFKTQPICFVQMASLKRGIKLHMHCPGQLFFLVPHLYPDGGRIAQQPSSRVQHYCSPTIDVQQTYCTQTPALLQPTAALLQAGTARVFSPSVPACKSPTAPTALHTLKLTYYEVRTNKINNTKISHFLLKMHMLYHQTFLLSFCYVILQVTIVFNLNLS